MWIVPQYPKTSSLCQAQPLDMGEVEALSIEAIKWAYNQTLDGPSGPGEKFVLVTLAEHADEKTDDCYPGHKRLAEKTGYSTRSILRYLAKLEERGLISRRRRYRPDGYRTSDKYLLNLRCHAVAPYMTPCPILGDTVPILGDTESPQEPSVEPSVEGGGDAREAHQENPEAVHNRCCELIGVSRAKHMAYASSGVVRSWLAGGLDPEVDIYPTLARLMADRQHDPPGSMAYFTKAVTRAKVTREAPLPEVTPDRQARASPHRQMFNGFQEAAKRAREREENTT